MAPSTPEQWLKHARRVGPVLVAAVVTSVAPPARAWYFPEHTELTRLALQDYAPAFVAETLTAAVADAREVGLSRICPGVTTRLDVAFEDEGRPCVPYGALAALAGDHSNYWYDLAEELTLRWKTGPAIAPWRAMTGTYPYAPDPLGVALTEAAQATWISFESSAPRELVEVWTGVGARPGTTQPQLGRSVNPRDYVRSLDAALFVLDSKYASRARGAKTHFHDATASAAEILQQSVAGDFDNALAQLMVHHFTSLSLAVQSRTVTDVEAKRRLRTAALLEHAFALHFVEDALAGGHIATDPAVTVDERRAQRHDYFNRQGLAVRRSLMTKPCDPKQDRQPSPRRSMGLSPCWVAHGDGFATATDRAYVTEAAARVQTVFALALLERLPDDFERQREGLGPCTDWLAGNGTPDSGCDLAWTAFLLDPSPEWTRTRPLTEPGDVGSWAATIIGSTWTALASLSARNIRCCANAGSPVAQPNLLPPGIFDGAFASDEAAGGSVQPAENIGYWLVRPLLVAWPAAQSDVTTLAGGDEFHRGWQAQIAVNAAFGAANLFHSDASTSVWAGVGGGVGYATVGIFPGRANRTLFETNAGVAQGYYLAGSNVSFRSLSVLEIRAPITSFALYGAAALFHSRLPLALLGDKMSWGLLGGRIYATPGTNKLLLSGWDAEIANLYLGTPGSSNAALSGITASELRIRLGWRSTNFERIHSMFDGAPFVALELSSGFYTTLL